MRYVTHLVSAAALLLAAAVGQISSTHAGDASPRRTGQTDVADVYCPAEDSCELDFANGRWTVTRLPAGSW